MSPGGQGTGRAAHALHADGRWSAAGPTDRTADPQQVDMPACNKKGVSGGHARSITRAISFCPESFSPLGAARGQRSADAHVRRQPPGRRSYSGWPPFHARTREPRWQPGQILDLSRRSARPDPADREFRWFGRRQMLAGRQVPPGHSRWRWPRHDSQIMLPLPSVGQPSPQPGYPGSGGLIRPRLPGASCADALKPAHPR